MFNPFKRFKEKRARKKQIKRLAQISSVFGLMEKLSKSGLIHWDRRRCRLFIAEPLATVMLAKGAQAWMNFLNNVYLYAAHQRQSDMWSRELNNRQNKAIVRARRLRPSLSSDEIQRIRRGVAEELVYEDVAMPNVERFEFYVVADNSGSNPETTLCGTYDPDTDQLDVVLWEDIQAAISAYHK